MNKAGKAVHFAKRGVVLAAMAMAPAAAQAGNGWYVGLEGGANFLRSQDLKVYDYGSGVEDGFELAHVRFDTGWIAGGVIGYTYEDYGLHPEFAFEYRRNDFDFLRASAKNLYPGESTHDVDGYEAAYSILFNLWYDFNKTGRLKPYIGIGGGVARVEFHNAGYTTPLFPNSELSNDHDLGYAYQAGVGLSYDLTPHWTLSADYRYFATEPNRFDLNDNDDSNIKTPYRASTAMLGIRYFFGKPPEQPAPAPAPPVEVVPPVIPPPPPPPPPPPCESPAAGKAFTLEGCNVGDKVVLRGVNFEFDKATLTPDAKVLLDIVSDALIARTDIMVELDGHTDSKGSDEYNQKLSERRSESVKQYLVGRGIDAGRMTTMGFGESQPVQDNATDEGREYNRRVELKVTASNGNVTTEAAKPE